MLLFSRTRPRFLICVEYLFKFYRNMSVIGNMQSLILTSHMDKWLEDIRHEKGLYHMMYDKDSIAKFQKDFELDGKQSKTAINDWYSERGD